MVSAGGWLIAGERPANPESRCTVVRSRESNFRNHKAHRGCLINKRTKRDLKLRPPLPSRTEATKKG